MKQNRKRSRLALLAALALALTLSAGCAGERDSGVQPPDGAAASGEQTPAPDPSESAPAETGETAQPDASPDGAAPSDQEPAGSEPGSEASGTAASEEPTPAPTPTPTPTPATPTPTPEAAASSAASLADGLYTVAVTLEGGSGKATVASPAALRVENGAAYATIVWSSSNYDYMKVGGQTLLPITLEGGSTFEIPVAAFDQKLDVVADTVAMSAPHEIAYTLTFSSASITAQ